VDLIEVRYVHLQGQSTSAHHLDFPRQLSAAVLSAQAERDVSAGVGKCERDRSPQSARRSRHERYMAREVEPRKISHETQRR
jgi:hypothetical protein